MQIGEDLPSYRIRYLKCEKHDGQRINLICLEGGCHDNALICSICANNEHINHNFKPLKFYLDQLYRQYANQKSSNQLHQQPTQVQLKQLEDTYTILMMKIKMSVQQIADQYQQLQQSIIDRVEQIKHQILSNQARRNNFQQFYESLVKNGNSDPNFQVQNYFPKPQILQIIPNNCFQNFTQKFCEELKKTKKEFITIKYDKIIQQRQIQQIEKFKFQQGNDPLFILPKNIIRNGNQLIQTVFNPNSHSICLFKNKLKDMAGKLRLKIINMNTNAKITLGMISDEDYKLCSSIFKPELKLCYWMDSKGKSNLSNYNYITSISSGQTVDACFRKNHCKIVLAKNICDFLMPTKENHYFFIALEGNCKVQVIYPYSK